MNLYDYLNFDGDTNHKVKDHTETATNDLKISEVFNRWKVLFYIFSEFKYCFKMAFVFLKKKN